MLPSPEELLAEIDAQTLADLVGTRRDGESSGQELLTKLDDLLARHGEPTKLRGFVQFIRSGLLLELGRQSEAATAVEESVQLLPAYSGPLFQAASLHTYAGNPGRGADFLLRAAALDRAMTLRFPDYELMSLITRLEAARQDGKAELVADRFLDLGWSGTTLDAGSKLALRAIRLHAGNGNVARARQLVPRITVPAHAQSLLIDKEFEFLWPSIEQWGGTRLEKLWRIHLTEVRNRFKASADDSTMTDYSRALESANRSKELIEQFVPLFAKGKMTREHEDLLFVITNLGQALVLEGKTAQADEIYERARAMWPLGERTNNLNVHSNYAMHLLYSDRAREALPIYDSVLAAVGKHGPEVNQDAVWIMRHHRACILQEVGKVSEARLEAELLANEGAAPALGTFLCIDQPQRAKALLLERFKSEDKRGSALDFMQRHDNPEVPTVFGRRQRARLDSLRNDPDALRALAVYGRVLPYSLSDGAIAVP